MQHLELPQDFGLVLQEVSEHGEEEIMELAETLSFDRSRLQHIIQSLQHKGLVSLSQSSHGVWIRLSAKGKKFMSELWPESGLQYGYSV
jgi:DNA-binding MarR family transcriptional regulator